MEYQSLLVTIYYEKKFNLSSLFSTLIREKKSWKSTNNLTWQAPSSAAVSGWPLGSSWSTAEVSESTSCSGQSVVSSQPWVQSLSISFFIILIIHSSFSQWCPIDSCDSQERSATSSLPAWFPCQEERLSTSKLVLVTSSPSFSAGWGRWFWVQQGGKSHKLTRS